MATNSIAIFLVLIFILGILLIIFLSFCVNYFGQMMQGKIPSNSTTNWLYWISIIAIIIIIVFSLVALIFFIISFTSSNKIKGKKYSPSREAQVKAQKIKTQKMKNQQIEVAKNQQLEVANNQLPDINSFDQDQFCSKNGQQYQVTKTTEIFTPVNKNKFENERDYDYQFNDSLNNNGEIETLAGPLSPKSPSRQIKTATFSK